MQLREVEREKGIHNEDKKIIEKKRERKRIKKKNNKK